jgi:hypothetical protein
MSKSTALVGTAPLDQGVVRSPQWTILSWCGPASFLAHDSTPNNKVNAERLPIFGKRSRSSERMTGGSDSRPDLPQSMIRKSGNRFSEKIMLKQRDEIMMRIPPNHIMI